MDLRRGVREEEMENRENRQGGTKENLHRGEDSKPPSKGVGEAIGKFCKDHWRKKGRKGEVHFFDRETAVSIR